MVSPNPDFLKWLTKPTTGMALINSVNLPLKISSGVLKLINDSTIEVTEIDTDTALTSNSDTKIPTEKAIKYYVDNALDMLMTGNERIIKDIANHELEFYTNNVLRVVISDTNLLAGALKIDSLEVGLSSPVIIGIEDQYPMSASHVKIPTCFTTQTYVSLSLQNLAILTGNVRFVESEGNNTMTTYTSNQPSFQVGTIQSNFYSTEDATPTTASVKLNGGLLVSKRIYADTQTLISQANTTDMTVTGFQNLTDSTFIFNDASRVFQLSPTSTSFSYFINGVKYTKFSPESITLPNSSGTHYIYYDGILLSSSLTFTDNSMILYPLVAVIYYNITALTSIFVMDQRHGISMSPYTHRYNHIKNGSAYYEGLTPADFTIGNGSLDSHAQFTSTPGTIFDEDLRIAISGKTLTQSIKIIYLIGNTWTKSLTRGAYFSNGSNLFYNQNVAGVWQLTSVTNARYCLGHIFVSNENNIFVVLGTESYLTVNDASNGAITEMNSIYLAGFDTQEFIPVATILYESNSAYLNTIKGRVKLFSDGSTFIDWRKKNINFNSGSSTPSVPLILQGVVPQLQIVDADGTDTANIQVPATGELQLSTTSTKEIQTALGNPLHVKDTTAASAYNVASTVLDGGLGVAGSIYSNTYIYSKRINAADTTNQLSVINSASADVGRFIETSTGELTFSTTSGQEIQTNINNPLHVKNTIVATPSIASLITDGGILTTNLVLKTPIYKELDILATAREQAIDPASFLNVGGNFSNWAFLEGSTCSLYSNIQLPDNMDQNTQIIVSLHYFCLVAPNGGDVAKFTFTYEILPMAGTISGAPPTTTTLIPITNNNIYMGEQIGSFTPSTMPTNGYTTLRMKLSRLGVDVQDTYGSSVYLLGWTMRYQITTLGKTW